MHHFHDDKNNTKGYKMNKIAIFVSGTGDAALRLIKLFNEGNRVKTVLLVADDSALSLLDKINDKDVTLLHIPDQEWHARTNEVKEQIKDNDVTLLVLDNFALDIPDELLEATDGKMIKVSSSEEAPREVVGALEADLRKPVEEIKKTEEEGKEEYPSPESEWADALKIQFTPPKIPNTPPDVPQQEIKQQPQESAARQQPDYKSGQSQYQHHPHNEPMPSTWLIWSVLTTVFCCFIPGIIAIIFSSQVSAKYYAGDMEGAKRASRMAEIWIIVSVVLGVLTATLYLPFTLIGW